MRIHRFFDAIYADNGARRSSDRRFAMGDLARYARNALLRPIDDALVARHADREAPVVFIVGAPRSGTTLLFQLIVRHLAVAYPSNELARFWSAPLVGSHLLSARHRPARPHGALESRFGRDLRRFGPHEFSWFWHYWGDFRDYDDLPPELMDHVDWVGLTRRLSALARWHSAPYVLKSINFTIYQIETLVEHLPGARFLWIRRDPLYCAQSIFRVREDRYGDPTRWWSVRPRDHEAWRERPPAEQIAYQIADIDAALTRAQHVLGQGRMQSLTYERLTENPRGTLEQIAQFLDVRSGSTDCIDLDGLAKRNQQIVDAETWQALASALERAGLEPESDAMGIV